MFLSGYPDSIVWQHWHQLTPVLRLANYYQSDIGLGYGPRYIQEFQLILVQDGRGWARVEDRQVELEPGSFLFYGPEQRHEVKAAPGAVLHLIGLVFLFVQEDERCLDPHAPHAASSPFDYKEGPPRCPLVPSPPLHVNTRLGGPVRRHCEALVAHFRAGSLDRPMETRGLLLLLFQAWLDAIHESRPPARYRDLVHRMQDFLLQDLADPPPLENFARDLQVSVEHLGRLFKAGTGTSVREFLEQNRLLQARRLLLEGNLNVAETARAVGFSDPYYFSRRFSKRFGISPSELRQRRNI